MNSFLLSLSRFVPYPTRCVSMDEERALFTILLRTSAAENTAMTVLKASLRSRCVALRVFPGRESGGVRSLLCRTSTALGVLALCYRKKLERRKQSSRRREAGRL